MNIFQRKEEFKAFLQHIKETINKDAKNEEELIGVLEWALNKAKKYYSNIEKQKDKTKDCFMNPECDATECDIY